MNKSRSPHRIHRLVPIPALLIASCLTLLSACGGGGGGDGGGSGGGSTASITIGGGVSGLTSGQLSLVNNGDTANAKTVTTNGSFQFAFLIPKGGSYNVTVFGQPAGQVCSVVGGHGSSSVNASTVQVICSSTAAAVSVSGTVTGLATGSTLQLVNNADSANTVSVAGSSSPTSFTFSQKIAAGSSYAIAVGTQPSGQICQVSNASGASATSNISNVKVNCAANTGTTTGLGSSGGGVPGGGGTGGNGNGTTTFNVGGSVTGLASGSLTLLNNGDTTPPLTVSSNGAFTFGAPMVTGGTYAVSVSAQPTGQLCSVGKATGVVSNANINSVTVTCASNSGSGGTNPVPVTVGGTVTGLTGTLTLLNNGDTTNPAVITSNGSYSFPALLSPGGSYNVTVAGQPAGQTCTLASRLSPSANNIVCSPTTYTLGGTISGLTSGTVGLMFNGDAANAVISGNGSFTFAVPVAAGGGYQISLAAQPGGGQACGIDNPLGSNMSANVSNITVTCASATAVQTASPVIHGFTGSTTDADTPRPSLRLGPDGNLYGLSKGGGASNAGSIYRVTPAGATSLVYSFPSSEWPLDIAFGLDGNLYGLTYEGGTASLGVLFRLTLSGIRTTLYSFTDVAPDLASQFTLGPDGNLYVDGVCENLQCAGMVKLNPFSGTVSPQITFDTTKLQSDHIRVSNLTLGYDGNFYGVSVYGATGSVRAGCIFTVSTAGVVNCIYNFNGGATPSDGSTAPALQVNITALVQHTDGNLYGTIDGSVFKITPAGNYTLLHTFANDTFNYLAGTSLVSGTDGNLYGMKEAVNPSGSPTLFQITPSGTVTSLYNFVANGRAPKSLTLGSDGYLYGTTNIGGTANEGTVIKMLP